MTAPKFTPAPWVVEINRWDELNVLSANERDRADAPVVYYIAENVGGRVNIDVNPYDYSEQEANAHLIASAPELYEALEKCREWVQLAADHPAAEPGVYDALWALDAALAKARGESNG